MTQTFRLIVLLVILIAGALLQAVDRDDPRAYNLSSPDRQAEMSEGLDLSQWSWRYWSGGYLIVHNLKASPDSPVLALFDQQGARVRTGIVWFPSASAVSVRGVTADSSGTIFASGATRSVDGSLAFFIAQLNRDGLVSGVVRTSPFIALHVCAPGDGTVWALGTDRQAEKDRSVNLVLRQFSFAKGEVRALLDLRSFESGTPIDTEAMSLFCNTNTIGVFLTSTRASIHEWVEFDINKSSITTWELPNLREKRKFNGFAFTSSGQLFAALHDYSSPQPTSGLFTLGKQKDGQATWVPIGGTFESLKGDAILELLGSENDELVYAALHGDKTIVLWSHVRSVGNRPGN
jgi:hypothetical protein